MPVLARQAQALLLGGDRAALVLVLAHAGDAAALPLLAGGEDADADAVFVGAAQQVLHGDEVLCIVGPRSQWGRSLGGPLS